MADIRTFICFELPPDIKDELAELQNRLKKHGRGVGWTNADGIHLTLKFLGDVPEEKIDSVTQAVKTASTGTLPFEIKISGTGAFPNLARPRVYWVGVHEPSGVLFRLQNKVEEKLAGLGFAKENRKFSPHLTLGRVRFDGELQEISQALEKENLPPVSFTADKIIVMQSKLSPKGATYIPLAAIHF